MTGGGLQLTVAKAEREKSAAPNTDFGAIE